MMSWTATGGKLPHHGPLANLRLGWKTEPLPDAESEFKFMAVVSWNPQPATAFSTAALVFAAAIHQGKGPLPC